MCHRLRNDPLSFARALLIGLLILLALLILPHNCRLHIIQSILHLRNWLPQCIEIISGLQKAMSYGILTVLRGINTIYVLIQLTHQRVYLVPCLITLSKRNVSVLELCGHFFLQEFQSIVYEFNLFGDPEWKSLIAFIITHCLPRG